MNDINIIDVEASGLDWDSYPIEIAVLVDGRMQSWLIKPEPCWTYWNDTAESMHGICRETLIESGELAFRVAIELNDLLEESDGVLYSDAAPWDGVWVRTLFEAVGETQTFQILSIADLLSEEQRQAFEDAQYALAQSGKYRLHRAEPDVRMIEEAYRMARDGAARD